MKDTLHSGSSSGRAWAEKNIAQALPKCLIYIVVVLASSLFHIQIANAALLTFKPLGSQLDADPINDIGTGVGNKIIFDIMVDTTGLDGPLQSFAYSVNFDGSELKWTSEKIDVESKFGGFFDAPSHDTSGFRHRHTSGSIPSATNFLLDQITFEVLSGLKNDGNVDFSLSVFAAFALINNQSTDVTNKFTAPSTVEAQVPEPSSLSLLVIGLVAIVKRRSRRTKNHNSCIKW